VVKLVVGPQSRQGTHADTVGKEDLRRTVDPGRTFFKLGPVDVDVVLQALHGTLQSQSSLVNFTNILPTAFVLIYYCQKIRNVNFKGPFKQYVTL